MDILIVKELIKYFRVNSKNIQVLDIKTLNIPKGKMICILGHSGSGKSTLLEILAGIQKKNYGKIIFNNGDVKIDYDDFVKDNSKGINFLKENIAFSFQDSNLLSYYTVKENVEFPLLINNVQDSYKEERARGCLYRKLGIDNILGNNVKTISGGQKQRVSLARATIKKFDILFTDEPTGNVGPRHEDVILSFIKNKITIDDEKTAMIVTHNLRKTIQYADVIIVIQKKDDDLPGIIDESSIFEMKDGFFKNNQIKVDKEDYLTIKEILIKKMNGEE